MKKKYIFHIHWGFYILHLHIIAGFKVNSGEYKLMGLAPYGEPKYVDLIKDNLIDIKKDGSFKLSQEFFDYATGLKMTSDKFHKLFNQRPRDSKKDKLTQFHMDVAASIQKVTEDVMISMAYLFREEFNIKNLCFAGGVALNCVANGKILEKKYLKIYGYNQPLVMLEVH